MAELLKTAAAEQRVFLSDGRQVSYSDCGDPDGFPVIYFHPLQGNRIMGLSLHRLACELHLRIITPDRPGYGHSTPQPDRTVLAYIADVSELCRHLGIKQFGAMGSSCGSMYALACSWAPETCSMLKGTVLIIPPWIPPSSNPHWSMLGVLGTVSCCCPTSTFTTCLGWMNARLTQQVEERGAVPLFLKMCSPEEKEALASDPEAPVILHAFFAAKSASGAAGVAVEAELAIEKTQQRKLAFNYTKDVRHPIRVYVGSHDSMLSARAVKAWADAADNVEVHVVDRGTHEAILWTHAKEGMVKLASEVGAGRE